MTEIPSKSGRALLFLGVLALAGTAGGFYHFRAKGAEKLQAFHGNVDIRDVTLSFRVGGRVSQVSKNEGDRVQAGELVANLDAAPYNVALLRARAAVEVARAQLARVEAGSRREDIAEARAILAERRASGAQADDTLSRITPLARSGVVTEMALVEAKSSVERTQANVHAAEATVAKLLSGTRVEEIAVARAQLAEAEAALGTAELGVSDTRLEAATAGVVVTRAIEPGAMLAAGAPALVVAFDDPVWIRGFAAEAELGRIAPGTAVDVYTDARPSRPYRGRVGYVASQAEFTPKNVETAELRTSLVYRFRVVVSEHDHGLRQGMPVTIVPSAKRAVSPDAQASTAAGERQLP